MTVITSSYQVDNPKSRPFRRRPRASLFIRLPDLEPPSLSPPLLRATGGTICRQGLGGASGSTAAMSCWRIMSEERLRTPPPSRASRRRSLPGIAGSAERRASARIRQKFPKGGNWLAAQRSLYRRQADQYLARIKARQSGITPHIKEILRP